jgi:predicted metal-dependent hydrolase
MWPVALLGAGVALAYASTRGVANITEVKSRTDGKVCKVQNLPDKQQACERLAEVRQNLDKLMQKYRDDTASAADPRVKVLLDRYNPDNMCENDINADSTSYSENKGDKIVVCLRDKAPPYKLVDTNTIMFVVLHEMAHLMTTTIGHTPEFWTNFKRILQDAVSVGVYTPVNYDRSPTSYCGMTISSTPI